MPFAASTTGWLTKEYSSSRLRKERVHDLKESKKGGGRVQGLLIAGNGLRGRIGKPPDSEGGDACSRMRVWLAATDAKSWKTGERHWNDLINWGRRTTLTIFVVLGVECEKIVMKSLEREGEKKVG